MHSDSKDCDLASENLSVHSLLLIDGSQLKVIVLLFGVFARNLLLCALCLFFVYIASFVQRMKWLAERMVYLSMIE